MARRTSSLCGALVWAALVGVLASSCSKAPDGPAPSSAPSTTAPVPPAKPSYRRVVSTQTIYKVKRINQLVNERLPRTGAEPVQGPTETTATFKARHARWQRESQHAVAKFDQQVRQFCIGTYYNPQYSRCARTEMTGLLEPFRMDPTWECYVMDVEPLNGPFSNVRCATTTSGEVAFTVFARIRNSADIQKGQLVSFSPIDAGIALSDHPTGIAFGYGRDFDRQDFIKYRVLKQDGAAGDLPPPEPGTTP